MARVNPIVELAGDNEVQIERVVTLLRIFKSSIRVKLLERNDELLAFRLKDQGLLKEVGEPVTLEGRTGRMYGLSLMGEAILYAYETGQYM